MASSSSIAAATATAARAEAPRTQERTSIVQAPRATAMTAAPTTMGIRTRPVTDSAGSSSGRSVSKQPVDPNAPLSGCKEGSMNAKTYDVNGIDTRIRYDSSRNPPFTVMTSMPCKP